MRPSPLDPLSFHAKGGIAFAHFLAGWYDEAITWAESALRERPNYLAARELAAASALAGHVPEAQKAIYGRSIQPCALPLSRIGSLFAGSMISTDCRKFATGRSPE
jgi:hypothetical protein